MIGARFNLKRLFERFDCFGSVAPIELEDSTIIEGIRIARRGGCSRQTLVANGQISANASYNVSLVAKFVEQTVERRFGRNEVLSIKHPKSLLEGPDRCERPW